MVNLRSEADVKAWLEARPEATRMQDAVTLASRAALRVLPSLFQQSSTNQNWFWPIVIAIFRANAIARLYALRPSQPIKIAADHALSEIFSFTNSFTESAVFSSAFSSAFSALRATTSVDFARLTARSIFTYATFYDAPTTSNFTLWEVVSDDARRIENSGAKVSMLILLPLPHSIKYGHHTGNLTFLWGILKQYLLSQPKGDWHIWVDWYERIVAGKASSLAVEEAYVLLDDPTLWGKGHVAVNAAIKKKLEEIRERESSPPEAPETDGAPTVTLTPEGFETVASPALADEINDSTQKRLHDAILRRIKRIDPTIDGLDNTQKALKEEYVDFAVFISNNFQDLDIATVWSCGAGLTDMVARVERQFEKAHSEGNTSRLAELPSETMISQLVSLTRDYAAFIMGFKQAQELALRAAEISRLDLSKSDQASRINNILNPMLKAKSLLAQNAKRLFGSISRATDNVDDLTVALLGAGITTTRNAIVSMGRAVRENPVFLTSVVVMGSPLDVVMKMTGDPNWETLRAASLFLSENADALYAFANHDPVMRRWLEWLIDEIRKVDKQT